MSTLLDSLHHVQDREARGAARAPASQATAVLTTLGYTRQPHRQPARARWPYGVVLVVLVVVAIATAVWVRGGADSEPAQVAPAPPATEAVPGATPTRARTPPPDPEPDAAPTLAPDAAGAPEQIVAAGPTGSMSAPVPTRVREFPGPQAPRTVAEASSDATPLDVDPTVPERFAAALERQHAGDVEAAERVYRGLVDDGLAGAEVHNNLGLLSLVADRLEAAAGAFEQAIAIDARHSKARNNLGVVRMRQGRAVEAAALFRAAVGSDASNVDAWVNLALALDAVGDAAEARRTLLAALEIDGRYAPAHYNLGRLFELAGDRQRAVAHYRRFLEYRGSTHPDLEARVRARVAALGA